MNIVKNRKSDKNKENGTIVVYILFLFILDAVLWSFVLRGIRKSKGYKKVTQIPSIKEFE
jgi:hypothetical protein